MVDSEVLRDRISSPPYNRTGVVAVVFPDGSFAKGTFSVVGKNDVITAAHLMYDPSRGGGVILALFFLGADYNSSTGQFDYQPYPEISYTPSTGRVLTFGTLAFQDAESSTFTAQETPHDVALVGLTSTIGDLAGWLNINPLASPSFTKNTSSSSLTSPSGLTAVSMGYPDGSAGMMERTIEPNLGNGDLAGNWFVGSLGLLGFGGTIINPGDSGGPLLVGGDLVGIASGFGRTALPPGSFYDAVYVSRWGAISAHFDEIAAEIESNDDLIGEFGTNKVTFDFSGAANSSSQTLNGFEANEKFFGDAGKDAIRGNGGDDTLIGGIGADILWGGLGADIFEFRLISELAAKTKSTDLIMDFSRLQGDKVSLVGIADELGQSLRFFASKPKGDATGVVWFSKSTLFISTDRDRAAEATIKVVGVSSLSSTDFLLG